jgi:hypothetical protein
MRTSEGMAFLEAMAQEIESSVWYSDVRVNGKKFHGLGPRYNTLSNPSVVNGGGVSSNNTSIWMVTHGDGMTNVIVPENMSAGVQQEDMGRQRVLDGAGNPFYVLEEKFTQHIGIAVKDWRYTGRIANINTTNAAAGSVDLYRLLTRLFYQLQGRRHYKLDASGMPAPGNTVIYMNRSMLEVLDNLAINKGAADNFVRLKPMDIQGQEVLSWRGIPIRETDALLNTEAAIA